MTEGTPEPITSSLAPDLEKVRRYIADALTRGAVATLVAAILGLLARMRDLNTELMRKLASKSRKRPPNESLRRLQLELPFVFGSVPPANDKGDEGEPQLKKKRGPKSRHLHGRPKLPEHLPRVPDEQLVPEQERTCPTCDVEIETIGFKTVEKLDVVPAHYVVRQEMRETAACGKCHAYALSVPDVVRRAGPAGAAGRTDVDVDPSAALSVPDVVRRAVPAGAAGWTDADVDPVGGPFCAGASRPNASAEGESIRPDCTERRGTTDPGLRGEPLRRVVTVPPLGARQASRRRQARSKGGR